MSEQIAAIASQLGVAPEDLGVCHRGTKLYDKRPRTIDPQSEQEGQERTHTPCNVVAWLVDGQWTTVNPFAP